MEHTPQNLGESRLEEANLKAQFEAEQKAMSAHLLGHSSCPACQEEGTRLIQDSHRLRAVNAKSLKALEGLVRWLETRPAGIHIEVVPEITEARAVIEEARK